MSTLNQQHHSVRKVYSILLILLCGICPPIFSKEDSVQVAGFRTSELEIATYLSSFSPVIYPGDTVVYTNGSCLGVVPNIASEYGFLYGQDIAPGTLLRKGRYFVRIYILLSGLTVATEVVSIVDNVAPNITNNPNQTVNVASGTCSALINYSGTATDNCGFTAPSSVSGFTLIGDYNGHRYFRSNSTYTWYNANNLAYSVGGYLATISDNSERVFLETQGQCWVGLNEIESIGTGTFTWANGETSSYSYWLGGRPLVNSDPSGVVINNAGGRWGDWPATESYRFILEMPIGISDQVTVSRTSGLASGSLFPLGNTTVTHVATDEYGNSQTASFIVNVVDNIAPSISCSASLSGFTTGNTCTGSVTVPSPSVSDNCAVSSLTWQMTGATTASSIFTGINDAVNPVFNNGATAIVYTLTDGSGNTSSCTTSVTITDNVAPVIAGCPSNTTIPASLSCQATIPNYLTQVTATDNCGGIVSFSQSPAAGNTISGTTLVTITATDEAGNVSTCSFQITVVDTTPPIFNTCPDSQILSLNGACQAVVPDLVALSSTTDNCSGSLTRTQSPVAGTLISSDTDVIVTITDVAGNSSTCNVSLVLIDDINPTITCPSNITVNVDANSCAATVNNLGAPITAWMPTLAWQR